MGMVSFNQEKGEVKQIKVQFTGWFPAHCEARYLRHIIAPEFSLLSSSACEGTQVEKPSVGCRQVTQHVSNCGLFKSLLFSSVTQDQVTWCQKTAG